jgi:hypothetical protein
MWPSNIGEASVRNFVGKNSSKITGVLRRGIRDGLRRYRMAKSGVPLVVSPCRAASCSKSAALRYVHEIA